MESRAPRDATRNRMDAAFRAMTTVDTAPEAPRAKGGRR
jgi:hypothetical protein